MPVPYSKQYLDASDLRAVGDVLKSDFLTQGPMVPLFEEAVAEVIGAKHAVAMNSATSALHIALMALDVTETHLIWTAANSFAASANCARYLGADVDFVDIDEDSLVISPETLRQKLDSSSRAPDVLVVVHFAGLSCQMREIWEICQEHGIRLVEDSSHALGATVDGYPVGSCRWSDINVFSFHPVKIITTGEGGMATTNDNVLASKMRALRTHGIIREGIDPGRLAREPWIYEQVSLGYNYRLNDISAALGISQLSKLDYFITERNKVAAEYKRNLSGLDLRLQNWDYPAVNSYHLFVVRFRDESLRLRAYEEFRAQGFLVNVHYVPIYHHPYYRETGFAGFSLPNTELYYSQALSLPCFVGIESETINKVTEMLAAIAA